MDMSFSTVSDERNQRNAESPASRRRRKVRDSIIEAAERVFASEGIEGLSIRRLAEEIDYSPSAIYKYFSSKTELIGCLKEAFFDRLIRNIEKAMDVAGEPDYRFVHDCVKTYVATALEKPHHYVAAFSGATTPATQGAEVDDETDFGEPNHSIAFNMLCDQISRGVDAGIFRSDLDCHMAAKSVAVSMHGLSMFMINMPGVCEALPDGRIIDSQKFIDFHSELLVRGISV
jgi:AcrR family transcriptional regulator